MLLQQWPSWSLLIVPSEPPEWAPNARLPTIRSGPSVGNRESAVGGGLRNRPLDWQPPKYVVIWSACWSNPMKQTIAAAQLGTSFANIVDSVGGRGVFYAKRVTPTSPRRTGPVTKQRSPRSPPRTQRTATKRRLGCVPVASVNTVAPRRSLPKHLPPAIMPHAPIPLFLLFPAPPCFYPPFPASPCLFPVTP